MSSRKPIAALPAFALALAVASFGTLAATASQAQEGEALDVRQTMQLEVNPAIVAIWAIGNEAMDEAGGIDPALMDDAKWDSLVTAADALERASRAMASAGQLHAAAPDNWATEEYEVSMDRVQAALDADPDGFRRLAAEFAEHVAGLKTAAEARDVAVAGELVAGMDSECETCHMQFWYADE